MQIVLILQTGVKNAILESTVLLLGSSHVYVVQSNYSSTLNKLQQRLFRRFTTNSDLLYNISKVPKNRSSGMVRKMAIKACMKNHRELKFKKIYFCNKWNTIRVWIEAFGNITRQFQSVYVLYSVIKVNSFAIGFGDEDVGIPIGLFPLRKRWA